MKAGRKQDQACVKLTSTLRETPEKSASRFAAAASVIAPLKHIVREMHVAQVYSLSSHV